MQKLTTIYFICLIGSLVAASRIHKSELLVAARPVVEAQVACDRL